MGSGFPDYSFIRVSVSGSRFSNSLCLNATQLQNEFLLLKDSIEIISNVTESFLASQSRVRFTSPSSQSHLKGFRVGSESIHDLVESSHKNGGVTALQFCVDVDSHEISHYSMTILWYEMAPNMYKMVPFKLKTGAQRRLL